MAQTLSAPLQHTLQWLSSHAGFPARRLPTDAEVLLLIATAAAEDEAEQAARTRFLIKPRDGAMDSALKAHALRRSRVHFKCDNSAKV